MDALGIAAAAIIGLVIGNLFAGGIGALFGAIAAPIAYFALTHLLDRHR
jgi:hypothetical protein